MINARIVAVFVAGIIAVSLLFTYIVGVREYDYAKSELVDKSRVLAQQIMATRHFLAVNQDRINRDSHNNFEFKGLNPARGIFLIGQYFNENRSYQIKQTSFPAKVRNPSNMPDQWEVRTIQEFMASPQLREVYGEVQNSEGKFFRYAVPLYIDETCLGCHGTPAGEKDVAGYAKEGYQLGDLRGIVAIAVPMAGFDATVRGMIYKLLIGGTVLGIFVTVSLAVILYFVFFKPAQKQLIHASQLAAVGEVAAAAAHEINNPLSIIAARSDLILQEDGLPDQVLEDIEVIQQNVTRVANYTRGLLSLARPCGSAPEAVDLNEAVDHAAFFVEKQLKKNGITLVREYGDPPPRAWVKPDQLQQIVLNLLTNACDALPEGGAITLGTGYENSRLVYISVADTGQGIKPEALEHIFEPFYTTKGRKGTGLGLAICYSLAHENGGKIVVDSKPGCGATFRVLLPRHD